MSDKRRKTQLTHGGPAGRDQHMGLAFLQEERGEAPKALTAGTEALGAKRRTESPAMGEQVREEVCGRENGKPAVARVTANNGSPGVDGMTGHELPGSLQQHGPAIREPVRSGTERPQPVTRVEIPKPDGGRRTLGIPTGRDRFVQQAVRQVLPRRGDRTLSEHRDGCRPGRSAHQAVAQAQQYLAAGARWVGDLDLEQCFDRVNHDTRTAKIADRVSDQRRLKRIRTVLTAGGMEPGRVSPGDEGTPQGGPWSPARSHSRLDEVDREWAPRGRRVARDADDRNSYGRSRRAGERGRERLTRCITATLTLTVNQQKSAVARPGERKCLGCSFTSAGRPTRRRAPNAVDRSKERVRELTSRIRGVSRERRADELTRS